MNIKKPILITGGCSFSQSEVCTPIHFAPHRILGKKENAKLYAYDHPIFKKKLTAHPTEYATYGIWTDFLTQKLNYTPWNTGCGSSGNKLIFKRVMRNVLFLLNSGINSELINVGVMWSQPERIDLFNSKESVYFDESVIRKKGPRELVEELTNITQKNSRPDELRERGWLRSGGVNSIDITPMKKYYYSFYNFEEHLTNTLEYIVNLQNFLKSHNIKYFFTTYQNIFSEYYHPDVTGGDSRCTPINDDWTSKNKKIWPDIYSEIEYLWESIDLEKFIFHSNDKHEYGGLGEFTVDNEYNFSLGHPSSESHSKFVNNLLLKKLNWKKYE
jgi:hypothetical protein